jgi:hypothetical protein
VVIDNIVAQRARIERVCNLAIWVRSLEHHHSFFIKQRLQTGFDTVNREKNGHEQITIQIIDSISPDPYIRCNDSISLFYTLSFLCLA